MRGRRRCDRVYAREHKTSAGGEICRFVSKLGQNGKKKTKSFAILRFFYILCVVTQRSQNQGIQTASLLPIGRSPSGDESAGVARYILDPDYVC